MATQGQFSPLRLHLVQRACSLSYDRVLFVKPHREEDGVAHALFVAGLPFLLQSLEAVLRELFSAFGAVSSVAVHAAQTTALVAFVGEEGPEKALRFAGEGRALRVELPEPEQPYGLKGWVEAHKASFRPLPQLQAELDEWMAAWEAGEEERRKAAAAADDPEGEGWTKVVRRRGRRKTADSGGSASVGAVAVAAAQQRAKGKQAQGLGDFYKFQAKERRRNELAELREKFAEDKRRLARLKAQRKFTPY